MALPLAWMRITNPSKLRLVSPVSFLQLKPLSVQGVKATRMPQRRRIMNAIVLVVCADILACLVAVLIFLWMANSSQQLLPPEFQTTAVFATLLTFLLAAKSDAYATARIGKVRHRVRFVLAALASVVTTLVVAALLTGKLVALPWIVGGGLILSALLLLSAGLSGLVVARYAGDEPFCPGVAIVGADTDARAVAERIARMTDPAVRIIGIYDDAWKGAAAPPPLELLMERARDDGVDAVVLAMSGAEHERISRVQLALCNVMADIYVAPVELVAVAGAGRCRSFDPSVLVRILPRPLTRRQTAQKAVLDRTLAPLIILLMLPAILLIALAIRLDSPGPIFFRQVRRGIGGSTFKVYKFRSMFAAHADADATQQTTRNDERITRVGRFLRKTSLDELPQLINVIQGNMSLVGPRPHAINTKAAGQLFPDAVAQYCLRYRIKPGITGWAQVNGWRGETKSLHQLEQRVEFDLAYIENWSLQFDIKILLLTLLREINSKVAF